MSIQKLAERVAMTHTEKDDVQAINPAFIAILVQLMPILLQWLQGCGDETGQHVQDRARKAGIFGRVALRLKLRRELGARDFAEVEGRKLADSLIKVAITEDAEALDASMYEVE
jgi:hypothetical protein